MRLMRAVAITVAVVAAVALSTTAGAAEGPPRPGSPAAEICRTGFGAGAFGGYLPTGDAAVGKATSVDLVWESGRLAGPRAAEAVGCVSVNGELFEDLSTSLGVVDNDGWATVGPCTTSPTTPTTIWSATGANGSSRCRPPSSGPWNGS